VARRYRLGERTVYRWRQIVRQEGRCCARRHAGGRQAVVRDHEDVLRHLVAETNDATLADYVLTFSARTGRTLSPSAMCRALQRLGLRRKKKVLARRRAGSTGRSSRACRLSS
jgi:putative transposase